MPDPFLREERLMRASAYEALPLLVLADDVSDALLTTLQRCEVPEPESDPPTAAFCRHKALFSIGLLALRALRCESLLIRSGYESEALIFKRVLSEAAGRAGKVVGDQSGEYARSWLAGRAGTSGSAMSGLPQSLKKAYSSTAHVGTEAVESFMAAPLGERTGYVVSPRRALPDLSYENLTLSAVDVLAVAGLLAQECGTEVPDSRALWERTLEARRNQPGLDIRSGGDAS